MFVANEKGIFVKVDTEINVITYVKSEESTSIDLLADIHEIFAYKDVFIVGVKKELDYILVFNKELEIIDTIVGAIIVCVDKHFIYYDIETEKYTNYYTKEEVQYDLGLFETFYVFNEFIKKINKYWSISKCNFFKYYDLKDYFYNYKFWKNGIPLFVKDNNNKLYRFNHRLTNDVYIRRNTKSPNTFVSDASIVMYLNNGILLTVHNDSIFLHQKNEDKGITITYSDQIKALYQVNSLLIKICTNLEEIEYLDLRIIYPPIKIQENYSDVTFVF